MGTHDKDVYTKAVKAESTITGKRWCSNCQYSKDYKEGDWKISANGRVRRWMCKDCVARKIARESK
jgi:hypothetical protein